MPTKIKQKSTSTLAELVASSASYSKKIAPKFNGNIVYPWLLPIAEALPNVKRLSYDHSLLEIVARTKKIKTEEIIGQLTRASFPFDKFWIEGPTLHSIGFDHGASNQEELKTARIGALVTADQEKEEFSFEYVFETLNTNQILRRGLTKGGLGIFDSVLTSPIYISDNRSVDTSGVRSRVSSALGIDLDEDKLMAVMFEGQEIDKQGKSGGWRSNDSADFTGIIDQTYMMADFLARLFVVLSSERIPNNFKEAKTVDESALQKLNQARKQMGRLPLLPTRPILIDIAKVDPILFQENGPKKIYELLGWTSVRRSKPIVSKHGKIFRRKPHDRRIKAAEDRRDAARVIFSGDNRVTVEIQDGRPIQVRGNLPSSKSADNG